MFIDIFENLCLNKRVSMNKACIEIGISRTSTAKWKNGSTPNGQTLTKIADYFGVSVDYLMTGSEAQPQKPEVSEEDIKVALFGGDEEVTDEEWNQVKNFVDFIKSTKKK